MADESEGLSRSQVAARMTMYLSAPSACRATYDESNQLKRISVSGFCAHHFFSFDI